ncbi:MAG: 4-(cytidine 5'-diphospho)-2-C-methyl-D-erythritol kinase [Planctomycetota bacterium]
MESIRLAAPAKCNLHLEILGRRSDGYHALETVFQTLDWADAVEVRVKPGSGTSVSASDPTLDCGPSNLARRAVDLLRELWPAPERIHVHLDKHLPAGGGLGGGSSDAAAVLRAGHRLWPERYPIDRLLAAAGRLGADVPFFLLGGTAHGLERGDRLTLLDDLPRHELTLLLPELSCSTPRVFAALRPDERASREAAGATVLARNLAADPLSGSNRLTAACARAYPAMGRLFDSLTAAGHAWLLAGSGSTVILFGHHPAPAGCRCVHTAFRPRARLDAT